MLSIKRSSSSSALLVQAVVTAAYAKLSEQAIGATFLVYCDALYGL
jgi:hypothetical protein